MKEMKCVDTLQCEASFRHIFTAHAQKQLFRSFGQNFHPVILFGDLDFL